MIIKSVKLNNIRSYIDQEIVFPDGSLLLAGDIGTGKSTILIAIEFALFGSSKSSLPAYTLLRHGKTEGSVELRFEVEGREYIVKRNLKRGKNSIDQVSGFLIKDGVKSEGTHLQLKTWIIEILGYPEELVTRSKDLIYRYTVYTPQEEMKRILQENTEVRLDTLRKVFNIDKYKRIRENAVTYKRSLSDKKKHAEGKVSDLEEKRKQIFEYEINIKDLNLKISEIKPKHDEVKLEIDLKKKTITEWEKNIEELHSMKKQLELEELNLKNILEKRLTNSERIKVLENEIEVLNKEIGNKEIVDVDHLTKEIKMYEQKVIVTEKNQKDLLRKVAEFNLEIRKGQEVKEKILKISSCPTCLQEVSKDHKFMITKNENERIQKSEENIKKYQDEEKNLIEENKANKEKIEALNKQFHSMELVHLKIKNHKDKKKELEKLNLEQENMKKSIGEINIKKKELFEKIEEKKDLEEEFKKIKEEHDLILKKEKEISIKLAALEKEKESVERFRKILSEEIEKKEEIKKQLVRYNQLINWITEYFMKLMSNIEKHVLYRVHNEFNELFKTWFSILLEEEGIEVRIDDEFTPIIEQNGYETYFENLSGGEKTAVSLSYRLALNKVINDVAGEINTKDIIMLDEPTDGFSTEQLDKMRDVLDELNMKQVIIVSHEDKIESFVDNVLRVSKVDHVSSVG